ncbi:MAG: hypothetical protein Q4G10_07720 [Bacteroidia bacterium]|nr:hypothetical protein [Bacteroidia bacterium]
MGKIIKGAFGATLVAALVSMAAGCTSMFENGEFKVASFRGGECIHTKASQVDTAYAKVGTLLLECSGGNLKTTLSGIEDNCSIKEGFDCSAMLDGRIIYIDVTAKSEWSANCICHVDDIVTEISGLEKGEYTLVYNYKSSTMDITEKVRFDFSLLLHKKVDFNMMMILMH